MNAGVANLAAAIDAFMIAPKRIVGVDSPPTWRRGFTPHESEMKYPIEFAGEQVGHLMIARFPKEQNLKFRLGILYGGMICRLDYTDETHSNSLDGVTSGAVPPVVIGPHYHSWSLNRRFFRGVTTPPKLHDAAPYTGAGRTFDAILRWFCTDTVLKSLPANHRIELPPPETLL